MLSPPPWGLSTVLRAVVAAKWLPQRGCRINPAVPTNKIKVHSGHIGNSLYRRHRSHLRPKRMSAYAALRLDCFLTFTSTDLPNRLCICTILSMLTPVSFPVMTLLNIGRSTPASFAAAVWLSLRRFTSFSNSIFNSNQK